MKTKGIPIWERYIEYIVLLIAILVFLGFTVTQFIGNPNAVTKESREISPGEVDELLREEAERLNSMLVQDAPSQINLPTPEPLTDAFVDKLDDPISPLDRIVAFSESWQLDETGGGFVEGRRYTEPRLPAPHTVIARQFFDGLPPEVVMGDATLAAMVGNAPYDLTWVTPVAIFDLEQVLAAFRAEDPGSEVYAIPDSWYRSRVTVLDVTIERQERTESGWSAPEALAPIPAQFSIRTQLAGKVDAMLRDDILAELGQPGMQEQIVQPSFYETRLASWTAPDPRIEAALTASEGDEDPVAEELRQLRYQRERTARQRQQKQEFVDESCGGVGGGTGGPGGGARGGGRSGGGGRSAPGGGFGAGAGQGRRTPGQSDAERRQMESRCSAAKAQIERLTEQLQRIQARITELTGEEAPTEEELVPNIMDAPELLVWGHDLGVEIGKTYRYRFLVDVYNPFFARKIQLVAEQQELAESVTLRTQPSDWSPELEIEPPLKFFVTDARPASDGGIGGATLGDARIEMFRFFDGRWWGEEARFAPGERLSAVSTEEREGQPVTVDFGTEWFVLDIIAVPDRQANERFSGQVLLQNLRTGEVSSYRNPEAEARDPELQKLRDEVELARVEVASAG